MAKSDAQRAKEYRNRNKGRSKQERQQRWSNRLLETAVSVLINLPKFFGYPRQYRPRVSEKYVWTNRSNRRFCQACGDLLTCDNSRYDKTNKVSFCKPCQAVRQKEWRRTESGQASEKQSRLKAGRLHPDHVQHLIKMMLEINKELRIDRESRRRDRNAFSKALNEAARKERARIRQSRVFFGKIFQPCVCADCGESFETLHPIELVAFDYKTPKSTDQRCEDCQYRFTLANHGGGPRRRCKKFDVPYELINPLVVFNRDGWICHICKLPIDPSLLGKPHKDMAPEMDHKWPLSLRIGQLKSPGHVLSNVFASHRICNNKKGVSFVTPGMVPVAQPPAAVEQRVVAA